MTNEETRLGHNGGPPLDWSDYGGFVPEARDSRSHPIIGYGKQVRPCEPERGFCYSVNEAWRDILHECRYADGYIMNGGREMQLLRGEMVGAVSYLAHRWNWTPKMVRGFLDRLERNGMISRFTRSPDNSQVGTVKGNHGGKQASIIAPCNYERFNPSAFNQGQATGQARGKQGASTGQAEGNKHNKETKEQRNNSERAAPEGVRNEDIRRTGQVVVSCDGIHGPDFTLDLAAIDMLAALIPFDKVKARQIAEVCARDWVANNTRPQHPMAAVKAAIVSHHRGDEVQSVRLNREAKTRFGAQPNNSPDDAKRRIAAIAGDRS